MKTGSSNRRGLLALAVWGLVGWILVGTVSDHRGKNEAQPLPQVGDTLSLDSLEIVFGRDMVTSREPGEGWLLILSSSCPACLALDEELHELERAAQCEQSELRPLIVEMGAPADSMRSVLGSAGLEPFAVAGPEALAVLRVLSVPTVLAITGGGVVSRVHSPLDAQWPPPVACGPGAAAGLLQ